MGIEIKETLHIVCADLDYKCKTKNFSNNNGTVSLAQLEKKLGLGKDWEQFAHEKLT